MSVNYLISLCRQSNIRDTHHKRRHELEQDVLRVDVRSVQSQKEQFDKELQRRGFDQDTHERQEVALARPVFGGASVGLPDAVRHERGGEEGLYKGYCVEGRNPVRQTRVEDS